MRFLMYWRLHQTDSHAISCWNLSVTRFMWDYSFTKNSYEQKVLKQDATYKNVISYLIFVFGILHSNDLLVTNESGIYVIFSQHNKLRKWILRFMPCWLIKYNYIKEDVVCPSLGAMTILFSLHYYGTIHQELLGKVSGKKNMRNT